MIVNLKTEKLKIGMFIDLSESWMANPFWKSQFEITSEEEIIKIIKAGINRVNVDTNKSKIQIEIPQENNVETVKRKTGIKASKETKVDTAVSHVTAKETEVNKQKKQNSVGTEKVVVIDKKEPEKQDSEDSPPSSEWKPGEFMPQELVNAIKDKGLEPSKRARVVQAYSIELMKNLLKNPTAEVISASKKGISEIVEVILDEDDTCQNLLKIVSHDFYTYTHSVNVGIKSILLAKKLCKALDKKEMDELGAGFFLHDLGKVNVDPHIINKPGRLTEEEMGKMRTHPYQGYKILSDTKQLTTEVWLITMQHHERDDGKGYPRKLKGDEIHPYARICCIADVYDALTAKRSYKKEKKPIEALKIMYKEMATHFNKELLEHFISLFREIT